MSDVTVTTEAPVLDLPKEVPLTNTPEARTPDGTLKDQSTLSAESTTTPTDKTTPDAPKEGVPETYAAFTVPEGQTLDPKAIEAATPIFKELGLTQTQAQKLVEFYSGQTKGIADAPQKTFNDMVGGWRSDVLKDTSLASGDGLRTDVKESIGRLKATLPADQRTSFDEVMNMSGLGNHPTIVKALNAWGKALSEGKHVAGNGPSVHGQTAPKTNSRPDAASAMFPTLPRQ